MRTIVEKIEFLDKEIAELKSIQQYCMDKGIGKKHGVKIKIAYASCVREYIMHSNTCKTHLGRLENDADIYELGDHKYHYLIEDSTNKDTISFVRKVNRMCFDSLEDVLEFRSNSSRVLA